MQRPLTDSNPAQWSNRFDLFAMVLSFMVVMIHASYTAFYPVTNAVRTFIDTFYTDYVSGFAVPGFFMLSAIKFYHNFDNLQLKRKLKNRVSSLLIPFLAWNTLSVIWASIFSYLPGLSSMVTYRETFTFSFENILGGVLWYKYIHPFWYMGMLMIFTVLCPLIYIIIRKWFVGIIAVVVLYAVFIFIKLPDVAWPLFPFKTVVYCSVFYLIGAIIGNHMFSQITIKPRKQIRIPAFVLFSTAVAVRYLSKDHSAVFIPSILLGTYSIWLLCGTFDVRESWILKTSFFIYPAHTFILPCVNKLLYFLLPNTSDMCIVNTIGGTILSYVICICCAWLLNKYSPSFILNVLNGRRLKRVNGT
jgi:hypothetical protein